MKPGAHGGDQFDWSSAYLLERGLQRRWRAVTCAFTVSLGTIPIVLVASPTGPDGPVSITVSVIAGSCALLSTLLWLSRWPTRAQSILFAVLASGAIAATCLAQSDPYAGLMGSTTFAVIGGFVAYFHSAVLVTVNLAVAFACAAVSALRVISGTGDIALTVSALLIVVGLNAGVPFGIYSLTHALRHDLRNAGHDPLTGLLNRSSLHQAAYELVMRNRDAKDYLFAVLIDLDDFKNLNDTFGHAGGDRALVSVSNQLRNVVPATAVIGRFGGEEFVVLGTSAQPAPARLAERLRAAIATLEPPVTASIGTSSAPLADLRSTDDIGLIDTLIRRADAAMYEAKHAGGNQVRHDRSP